MKEVNIQAQREDVEDLVMALQEVINKIQQGYTGGIGFDYSFNITELEEGGIPK